MKPTILLTVGLLGAGLLVSCDKAKDSGAEKSKTEAADSTPAAPKTPKEKAEALLGSLLTTFEKTATALESATDKASAEAAAGKIKEAGEELKKLIPEMEVSKKELSAEENEEMKKLSEEKVMPVMQRFMAASQKLESNPEVAAVLMPALMEFQQAMTPKEEVVAPE